MTGHVSDSAGLAAEGCGSSVNRNQVKRCWLRGQKLDRSIRRLEGPAISDEHRFLDQFDDLLALHDLPGNIGDSNFGDSAFNY